MPHDLMGKLVSSIKGQAATSLTLTGTVLSAQPGAYPVSVWTMDGQRGVARVVVQR